MNRRAWAVVVLGIGCSFMLAAAGPWTGRQTPEQPSTDPLSPLGYRVTKGAAPGYVEDRACATCHRAIWDTYQEVGMARSFYRPRRDNAVEDFSQGYFHEPSQRYYQMRWEGDDLVFRRYQKDDQGAVINAVEQKVDWILGSGNHSRTYLYRTPSGEMFQLPLAWYAAPSRWRMAPGFDRNAQLGMQRRALRACLFCHNAYPDVPAGSDAPETEETYPLELPSGIGCQRCHGPGADHARTALLGKSLEDIRATIVNPAKLSPRLRDDVCYECHMQPSVALMGTRRFGRALYSYRPGEPLSDYLVLVDPSEEGKRRQDRFEINHHPYRLRLSKCYQDGKSGLNCLTCHDPHKKVSEAARAAHYRAACLTCHDVDALAKVAAHNAAPPQKSDCVSCHMPKRRTQDVVEVVMTDHRITRRPEGDLLAKTDESDPVLVDLEFLFPETAPRGDEADMYKAVAVLRTAGSKYASAVARLETLLADGSVPYLEPSLELARGQLTEKRPADAVETLRKALNRYPDNPAALSLMALTKGGDELGESISMLRDLLAKDPDNAVLHHNLGRVLSLAAKQEEAIVEYRNATRLRPSLEIAWLQLGNALRDVGQLPEAVEAYRQGLNWNPGFVRLYAAIADALVEKGDRDQALRYLRLGARTAPGGEILRTAIQSIQDQE